MPKLAIVAESGNSYFHAVTIRLRLPELLKGRTAYDLSVASGGRISMSTAYRLVRSEGRLGTFNADVLEALCDVLQVAPSELFERQPARRARSK